LFLVAIQHNNSDLVITVVVFDAHVTMHRDKFHVINPTRCTNFSNLFLEWNFTCL